MKDNAVNSTGRRQFLKSLFGLGGVFESAAVEAKSDSMGGGSFYWADLRTGQIGFPTGHSVVSGLPGSLMKIVASAAIREDNLWPANQTFECTGRIVVKRKTYVCMVPHGRLTLTQALGHSCNVFFAQAAEKIDPKLFFEYASQFGLFSPVSNFASSMQAINAQASAPEGDNQSYVLGLAPELKPNALQIMRMVALIATRGDLPHLHSAESPEPDAEHFCLGLSDETWAVLQQGMRISCREGTAKKLDPKDGLHLAVKTGTAPHGKTFQSWIAGYFPYDVPRYAFCVRALSGTSQDQAVPLAHKYLFATDWP